MIKRLNENNIYFIDQFPTFSMDIDFNRPELTQNAIIPLVEQVENECPVGKHFGVSGIGEGIVWSAMYKDQYLQFKTKGEKHSVSKVKTIAAVDVEKINTIREFVESTVTENRLQQGLAQLAEMNLEPIDKNIGTFIKWVVSDVMKEEQDTIVQNQLDVKMICKEIPNVARKWYMSRIN